LRRADRRVDLLARLEHEPGVDLTSVTGKLGPDSPGRSPRTFFALTFALSIPFWVIGAVRPRELLPGLPVAALMALCPGLWGPRKDAQQVVVSP
jgi:hypothetical protein